MNSGLVLKEKTEMGKIHENMEELIGHTPMLHLKEMERLHDLKCGVYAKLEYFNPAGSAKDRIAKKMLDIAEEQGILKPGMTVVEPTSGNTGVGLAALCSRRGYRTMIVMPENMSKERIKLLQAHGADLVLTDAAKGMQGAIEKAEELVKEDGSCWLAGQFENPAGPQAHYETTGPEIWEDMDGNVDVLVCAVGTGGTITGTGKYLKEKNPGIKIFAVEPADSPVLSGGNPGPHGIQGIGAGFVPQALDTSVYDEVIAVHTEESYLMSRDMSALEGILVGISSGAVLEAAFQVAKREESKGRNIVVILPDGGERYLTTELFG